MVSKDNHKRLSEQLHQNNGQFGNNIEMSEILDNKQIIDMDQNPGGLSC